MQRRLGTCCARIGWCRDLSTFAFSRAVRRRRSVARTCCTTRTIAALQLLLVHHRLVGMLIPLALACPRETSRGLLSLDLPRPQKRSSYGRVTTKLVSWDVPRGGGSSGAGDCGWPGMMHLPLALSSVAVPPSTFVMAPWCGQPMPATTPKRK